MAPEISHAFCGLLGHDFSFTCQPLWARPSHRNISPAVPSPWPLWQVCPWIAPCPKAAFVSAPRCAHRRGRPQLCGRWAPRHLLWREPNASQKACFGRVRSFVVACFSRKEEFPLPPGRSGPDLVARLLELETFAGAFGLVGSSCTSDLLANFGPVPGVPPSAELPQLQPYRSLDVSRLRLHGTGSWHIAPFLEGSLWLPFQEPNILRHGLPLGTEDLPDFEKEDAEEHLKLALLWDARGLLQLVPPLPAGEAFQRSCRIFNSYKSPEADRQIGDRRPANKAELHLSVSPAGKPPHCISPPSQEGPAYRLCVGPTEFLSPGCCVKGPCRLQPPSLCLPCRVFQRDLCSG